MNTTDDRIKAALETLAAPAVENADARTEPSPPLPVERRSHRVAMAIAACCLVVVGVGALLVQQDADDPSSVVDGGEHVEGVDAPAPVQDVSASEVFHFTDLNEMVAIAQLVVTGEVVGVGRGREFPAGEDTYQAQESHLRVTRVLHSASATDAAAVRPGDTITIEELAWRNGEPITLNGGTEPSTAGQVGVFFLVHPTSGPREAQRNWAPVGSQGRFFVTGSGIKAANPNEEFAAALQGRPLEELEQMVIEASATVDTPPPPATTVASASADG